LFKFQLTLSNGQLRTCQSLCPEALQSDWHQILLTSKHTLVIYDIHIHTQNAATW